MSAAPAQESPVALTRRARRMYRELHARYPRAADFIALRRELDPAGVFLNDHLRELFGA